LQAVTVTNVETLQKFKFGVTGLTTLVLRGILRRNELRSACSY